MKRYNCETIVDEAGTYGDMQEHPVGAFVYYSDASQSAERIRELSDALRIQADAWAHYRKCFEHVGAGDPMTGRAWMLCTRAEEKARAALEGEKHE